ncbi:MAG: Type II secretion system protein G [Candidatus Curtissbacteria bacterium GW2011_GWA1_40_47]|uniref:Type II secretion system protein GspG C-terminal domain-containing protein n=1 Tax=Candidatus Curtissbacteria bacterium RIFOXYA1_FULL_41_14 TaxID=1797737 RepID=A0A1F5HDI7_9BACT|nr:MAG: Type II secretion system protein G [Candidatus Curtissbacteria bacterium GW2011_GWA1_40_47]KKR75975.1 MAG: Type II secretion system protein G [Candidatus Curtissbacteria bacterium GW2011_GWD1_40_8]KKS00884.1 MAG: Type II secretion system protein G [Candidatus Curtissbacteria bacterium GW2011_GWC2_41_21]OGD92242.1 MAG: hypothetical protein A3E14_02640 [Candidatus Curtissbacteria bacterium RIFCSPHIGHO2_12_FULL_41_13]OGD96665.1 MAG: hypothetical protein A3B52_00970 [Candidatus Curtissbacte
MPTLVHSSPFDFAQGRQFIVHGNAATVNREPITVNRRRWRRGFTLIELLVVITIIGILAGIALVSYGSVQERSRDSRRKQDLAAVQKALVLYYQDFGVYPCKSELGGDVNLWVNNLEASEPVNPYCDLAPTYIREIPHDPKAPRNDCDSNSHSDYSYFVTGDGQYYRLYAQLENSNDPQASGPYTILSSCPHNYMIERQ